METTLGGDRLGTGNKQKIHMHGYGRSNHNLSEVFRTTMASGTLVPFMNLVGLPGDTFDIDLEAKVLTHPTIGPLFGSYKVQYDIFMCPIRLYQGMLHMNALNIGNDIAKIKLPLAELKGKPLDGTSELVGQQVNPSSLFSYLGVKGLGSNLIESTDEVKRYVNAVPLLAYWDIYKNYYSNKQEEVGYVIHHKLQAITAVPLFCSINNVFVDNVLTDVPISEDPAQPLVDVVIYPETKIVMQFNNATEYFDPSRIQIYWGALGQPALQRITDIFETVTWNEVENTFTATGVIGLTDGYFADREVGRFKIDRSIKNMGDIEPQMYKFDLSNIDDMKMDILKWVGEPTAFIVDADSQEPYKLILEKRDDEEYGTHYALTGNQEGLGLKTYLSDLFNNWINTEWIEGDNGINEITAVSTDGNRFTIDELNLASKIYKMLNRIAVSDGTFDSYIRVTYDHEPFRKAESPIYMGGMFQELVFQEVISNAGTEQQPLGTLAGRGAVRNGKGGKVTIRVDEHCYIMGIVSLTPRIDYSQGNTWDVNLKTLDDFHKPPLDEIGFQDLVTDQMGFWETQCDANGNVIMKSAGKQPAWTNYMTSVNRTFGNFALENEQMFMTLNRRYGYEGEYGVNWTIKDLTTYIDPVKFNNIFAYKRRDAQNFWVQIGSDIKARRKMSAKVMPNL